MADKEIKNQLEELRKNQMNGYITALEFGGSRNIEYEKTLDLLASAIDLIDCLEEENKRLYKVVSAMTNRKG